MKALRYSREKLLFLVESVLKKIIIQQKAHVQLSSPRVQPNRIKIMFSSNKREKLQIELQFNPSMNVFYIEIRRNYSNKNFMKA